MLICTSSTDLSWGEDFSAAVHGKTELQGSPTSMELFLFQAWLLCGRVWGGASAVGAQGNGSSHGSQKIHNWLRVTQAKPEPGQLGGSIADAGPPNTPSSYRTAHTKTCSFALKKGFLRRHRGSRGYQKGFALIITEEVERKFNQNYVLPPCSSMVQRLET